jgi:hypothetical protein
LTPILKVSIGRSISGGANHHELRRVAMYGLTVVVLAQFAEEYRPAVVVPTDVVHHQQHDPILGTNPQKRDPEWLVDCQVEGPSEFAVGKFPNLQILGIASQIRQIHREPGDLDIIDKYLVRLASIVEAIRGPQHIVAPYYGRKGITQPHLVERSPHSVRDTDIERGVRRVLGLHEPHASLP